MSWWLEAFRAFWPVAVTLGALASSAIFLWLATKFASKAELTDVRQKADFRLSVLEEHRTDHATRLKLVEDHIDASPTRQELHDEIAELSARLAALESGVKGIGKQLDTTNKYLHTLIDKSMPGAGQ